MAEKGVSAKAYIFIFISIVLWGFSFIWTNELIKYNVPIFIFIFMRMLIAAILMFTFSISTKKLQKIKKKDLKWFLLMSFFEPFVYFIGESYGLLFTDSATLASIIIATVPIFSLILGRFLYKERLTILNHIGVIMTLPGVFIFVFQSGAIKADYFIGVLFLIVAVIGSVGYSAICRRLSSDYNAFTITTYQFVFAVCYFLIPFVVFGLPRWDSVFISFDVIKPLLFLSVLCSCFAFVLYVESMKYLGMTQTVIWLSLIPVVSAFGSFMSGNESFTIMQLAGIAIVIMGVVFSQLKSLKKKFIFSLKKFGSKEKVLTFAARFGRDAESWRGRKVH